MPVHESLFGEGLARVGSRLIQLTWRAQLALEYEIETLAPTGRQFSYTGEGWGLCYDGDHLWMSNGSNILTMRDAATFTQLGSIPITQQGKPVHRLNELECVGDFIYANVWQTDRIVKIEKTKGRVVGEVDARGLLPGRGPEHGVLNGIAHNPRTDTFYLTGKLWPKMFEVRFRFANKNAQ